MARRTSGLHGLKPHRRVPQFAAGQVDIRPRRRRFALRDGIPSRGYGRYAREVVTMRDRQRLRLRLTIIAAALVAAAPVAYALTMDTLANAREVVI
jgi:hypothetical protein